MTIALTRPQNVLAICKPNNAWRNLTKTDMPAVWLPLLEDFGMPLARL